MNYNETKQKFLMNYPDYINDINNFTQYLESIWQCPMSDSRIDCFMKGLSVTDVKNSLEYLVENEQYKKKETARRYMAAVGQFLEFIKGNTDICNTDLYTQMAMKRTQNKSYLNQISSYIAGCEKLGAKEPIAMITNEKVQILLKWCDENLDGSNWNSPLTYKKASAALCMKLMLLYGITYRVARKIQIDQIDKNIGTINLSGYRLRFSPKLNGQMISYVTYKERNEIYKNNILLFTSNDGEGWKAATSSSGIPSFLNKIIGQTDLSGIVKYGISQLLKVGLNDSVIKKMTGASDELISHCLDQDDLGMERIINNQIVRADMYYDM